VFCRYNSKRIELSVFFTVFKSEQEIENILLHEIAHALVGSEHGHNETWKKKAIEIGCSGERCGAVFVKGKYEITCKHCGKTYHRHKRPSKNRISWCSKCGRSKGIWRFEDWIDSHD
jgi:predicted SprT family Zn-dependent metalloprotease